jgi:hypothetical protein
MIEDLMYEEEAFGILTDDQIYLDCTLVKPTGLPDDEMQALRVWVPRHPLTATSVIACARQEVQAGGRNGKVGHLVFDLRGTGYSEGDPRDNNFEMDLEGIRLWAEERFGEIKCAFMGFPDGVGKALMLPIRPGVVMESYLYEPEQPLANAPPLIYLATYGNFNQVDDARCALLAQAGYAVYGMDPLRYLLHAALGERLGVETLVGDLEILAQQLPRPPLYIGMPVAAGLSLFWAAQNTPATGVIAIGRIQPAFRPRHIFANDNPHTFFLARYVGRIPPRPVALVIQDDHSLGGEADEMSALYQNINGPCRLVHTPEISPDFLLTWINWVLERQ